MKVRVTLSLAGRNIDETLTGDNADDILSQAKARVARELGWKGLFLNALSPLSFAQKTVSLYNDAHKTDYASPQNASEYLTLGQQLGYFTFLPDVP